jgi:hypothetical protein
LVALAIAFSGLIVALAIAFLAVMVYGSLNRLEELGHLFFAVARSNLSIELIDREIPIPEWLVVDAEDGEESEEEEPAKVVSLLRTVKDKSEV